MNSLPSQWIDGWWEWIAASSLQVAAFVGVVAVASLLTRRLSARLRYALWTLVLIKVFLPTSLALPVLGVGHKASVTTGATTRRPAHSRSSWRRARVIAWD